MAQVEFTRRAHEDLRRLRQFLADKSPGAAERASAAIFERLDQLARFPESAPKLAASDMRELPVRFGRYGYVVRYGISGDRVIIARIFHSLEER
jgi:plasmid stabilization system protein ParE